MQIRDRLFDFDSRHVYVMGILNITPDSFSDGGKYNDLDRALSQAERMINEGADIIDVGGESTRPGYEKISISQEIERTARVIGMIRKNFDIPISIDSYKPEVVESCLDAGADIVNDIWGARYHLYHDDEIAEKSMAEVASRYNAPIVVMHNDIDEVRDRYSEADILDRVKAGLDESIRVSLEAGVKKEDIILDPGIGFAKTYEENLMVMKGLKELADGYQYPMLLGASRKSMIGNALDLPVNEREEGTIVTSIYAALAGCSFVRVHDVEKNIRALKMNEAIQSI